jgi:spermidine synthase
MTLRVRLTLACLFFLSGFSGLVYQVVWTRLAFASFGIIAPVLSVVLSVFMFGLAVGSWLGGRTVIGLTRRTGLSAIYFYAAAEMLTGVGAFAVPALFKASEQLLAGLGQLNSFSFLFFSALALGISIFPWCVCMGTTFPFVMAYIKEGGAHDSNSFSFLYLANVLGAMCGTALTALVLVEVFGFRHTLWIAAGGNFLIALTSAGLGNARQKRQKSRPPKVEEAVISDSTVPAPIHSANRFSKAILFSTGFIAMAMEVVWSRGFVGVLKTQVYSFALIVFFYLFATSLGSLLYRTTVRRNSLSYGTIFLFMAIAALLPIFPLDPKNTVQLYSVPLIDTTSAILVLGSICPLCILLGYLTPRLVDQYSGGHPGRAGSAYAANVVGCILGPLCACYLLLPYISTRYSLILLASPLIVAWLILSTRMQFASKLTGGVILAGVLGYSIFRAADFDERIATDYHQAVVRRDSIASVAAFGQGWAKSLLVNGFGMTRLTPITKCISHFPMAMHRGKPQSVLVICFGMGTSYRSALSWDVDTTAVELVPSVPKMFGFYHFDAEKYACNPHGKIVIDDGRRYLNRCGKKFDVIVVDPPPPVQAAGSSLLFSTEFYALARQHLNPGGIVQMWYPGSDQTIDAAVLRSMVEAFPHVRCFTSIGGWGRHILGSTEPIETPPMDQLLARMPTAAKADLVEWSTPSTAEEMMANILAREIPLNQILNPDARIQITDDRPMNEYYLLREWRRK